MASCVRNICTKNYQNLIIGFQVTVKNVGDTFLRQCTSRDREGDWNEANKVVPVLQDRDRSDGMATKFLIT